MQRRAWHLINAKDQVVGRLASRIASLLTGKHHPSYVAHHARGDTVVVLNAASVRFTGDKWASKLYKRHSGRPGGLKTRTAADLHSRFPTRVLQSAVKGMLPRNRLRRQRLARLRIFEGVEHPYESIFGAVSTEDLEASSGDRDNVGVGESPEEHAKQEEVRQGKASEVTAKFGADAGPSDLEHVTSLDALDADELKALHEVLVDSGDNTLIEDFPDVFADLEKARRRGDGET